MKLSNPEVYPVSRKFEDFLIENNILTRNPLEDDGEIYWNLPLQPGEVPKSFNRAQDAAKAMLEVLGELEHGSCDWSGYDAYAILDELKQLNPDEVLRAKLNIMEETYEDLITFMLNAGL